ncbi:uncharacterized protein [Rutidosis leptorrhynchoides]|uniref:uncharacterized protein n=1 Tax=Rutidosis leptorrhynchoides TaxID=125765 RepID=UPI003A9A1BAB
MEGFKRAGVEIEEAMKHLSITKGVTLCQAWVLCRDKNENEECVVKFGGSYYDAAFKDYYEACVKIEDGCGGLALKALKTHVAYFSRNIAKGELQALIPATSASESSCCLAICLRNIYTGDFDYAFEFFFSSYRNNPCFFLEFFFMDLKRRLPSFKFSSRQVLDADNLAAHNFDFIALLNEGEEKEEDCMEDIKQQLFGLTLDETNLKTKQIGVMHVRLASMNFADLMIQISQRFRLVSNSYMVYYLVKGPIRLAWISLQDDRDLQICIAYCTSKRITRLLIRVLPCTILNQGVIHTSPFQMKEESDPVAEP